MKFQFYDLLTQSTREVFETMSFLDMAPLEAVKNGGEIDNMDVTAIICLAGEISGYLAVHCDKAFARECAELISGSDASEIQDAVVRDTVGELANMIAGSLKRKVSAQMDLFDISLPSLFMSQGSRMFFQGAKENFPRLLVPFGMDEATRLYVELLYHKR